ncbi:MULTISPECIES: glutathione S-transferase [Bordetella]|uniref:Glutathione S-transferase n=1 Tax=Bordetella genomosp. 2 TaxID=1983456 RepID=A0A261V5L2_9BORD|nr:MULTISPECIES: glutathione S-transferase [Bordetella]OZI69438.1 glutathione S-transferase [Bordetella genomosp. 2]
MKIYFSPASPFVRKCMVVAHETGQAGRIEKLPSAAHPVNRDRVIIASNPLGQVPTLLTDDGQALYDSRVICEYLDHLGGGKLFPAAGPARWQALADQALADGILGAALLARYETTVRPEPNRWSGWIDGQMGKVADALAQFERRAAGFGDRLDIGTITLGCALGYLDFRYPDYDWRASHPACAAWYAGFGERPSMRATAPEARPA